jgi:ribose transport system permease protein
VSTTEIKPALELEGLGGGARLRGSSLRDYGIVAAFVALFVTLSVASDPFLTPTNLMNVLEQWAAVGIIAAGGTLVIIAGGFDLSVGAAFALSGVVAAKVAEGGSVELGILAGIGAGLAMGVVNGLLATAGRINPFVATLATGIVFRGLATAVTGGFLISIADPSFASLGRDEALGVKYAVWIFVAFALLCGFLLRYTTFGRAVYAAGGNPEAARLSGIRVGVVRAATFAISGLAAGLAGVIVASRVATGQADAGIGLELQAIAAIVIGGTSIMGGVGAIWRTVLGVLLLAMIGNGFNLLAVDIVLQQVFTGLIILAAVAVDAWSRRRVA